MKKKILELKVSFVQYGKLVDPGCTYKVAVDKNGRFRGVSTEDYLLEQTEQLFLPSFDECAERCKQLLRTHYVKGRFVKGADGDFIILTKICNLFYHNSVLACYKKSESVPYEGNWKNLQPFLSPVGQKTEKTYITAMTELPFSKLKYWKLRRQYDNGVDFSDYGNVKVDGLTEDNAYLEAFFTA